jgi:hypothetical protein
MGFRNTLKTYLLEQEADAMMTLIMIVKEYPTRM